MLIASSLNNKGLALSDMALDFLIKCNLHETPHPTKHERTQECPRITM